MVLLKGLTSSCCAWALLSFLMVTTAAATKEMHDLSSSSRRLTLDVHNSPIHRVRRLLRTHSKVQDDFRNLTSGDVPTMEVDYGGLHPFELNGHRMTQDRPQENVNYPIHQVPFVPLRIYYLDDQIRNLLGTGSSAQDDYINYILNTVLLDVKQLWGSYLTVIPIVNNLQVTAYACWGMYPNIVSQSILNSGLPDADVAIFVSMERQLTAGDGTVLNVCHNSDTLVVSTFCAVEQYGRPVVGLINFCPPDEVFGTNKTIPARSLQQQGNYPNIVDNWQTSPPISNGTATIGTKDLLPATIHQMGHILAMNFDLYRYFHDINTGDALTPQPFVTETSTCSDSSNQIVENPATNTFIRTISNGEIYFELVTSRIQAVVQSHFNCPTLTGARLENDPSQVGCVASHFNERLFLGEIMSHLSFQTSGVMSPLTLAVFEDSGWYKVTYHDTNLPYGQGWGCDFVFGDCIVNNTVPAYGKDVYCSTPTVVESDGSISLDKNDIYCDPMHQKWAVCDLFDQTKVPSGFLKSTASKSYFSNTNLVSTSDGFDSCPLPILTLQVDCNDTSTSLGINYQGEAYGADSRCINAEIASSKRKMPACFKVTCDAVDFQVVVNDIKCKYDGEVHTIKTTHGESASFECPRISLVCPELFCPSDCTGRGTCDYSKKPPQCSCANNATTSNCQFLDDTTLQPLPSPTPAPGNSVTNAFGYNGFGATSSTSQRSISTSWMLGCVVALVLSCRIR